jgi:C4-dicarboxylate-specific signal transduction histidine kinase
VEAVRDEEGRVANWYTVSLDINDRRELEDALRSTYRRLSATLQIATVAELSASIAHEINQPLASVVANAHACLTWLSSTPPNLTRARVTVERIIRDGSIHEKWYQNVNKSGTGAETKVVSRIYC